MPTNLDKFVEDAIRTESRVVDIGTDFAFLKQLLEAQIFLGNILDQIKKNVFYGKPFKEGEGSVEELVQQSQERLEEMLKGTVLKTSIVNVINPRVFHGIVGIATESTELLEAMHSAIYDREGDLDSVNVGEEMGDLDWYKAILCDELNISWDTSLTTVITKLRKRFPDKFDTNKAINRDLKAERVILEERLAQQNDDVSVKTK